MHWHSSQSNFRTYYGYQRQPSRSGYILYIRSPAATSEITAMKAAARALSFE